MAAYLPAWVTSEPREAAVSRRQGRQPWLLLERAPLSADTAENGGEAPQKRAGKTWERQHVWPRGPASGVSQELRGARQGVSAPQLAQQHRAQQHAGRAAWGPRVEEGEEGRLRSGSRGQGGPFAVMG